VAEKTAVFGGMVCRQRRLAIRFMAAFTEFLGLFFFHGEKPFMVLIMGKKGCSLRWGTPQKIEYSSTENKEDQVVYKDFF